ncbi:MAG: serine hydrolase, partial [Wenzhouxiangellaceae bacterium]
MVRIPLFFLFLPALACAQPYFPEPHQWDTVAPSEAGFDAGQLQAAVDFARQAAVTEPKDLHQVITDSFAPREPDFRILGPTKPREGASGIILKDGRIVAEWGDVHRVDMTFSAVKSYLATVAGLALRDGLIRNIDERAAEYVRDG